MFVSLDLESTGLDKKRDSIIEFGATKFDLEGHVETFQTFINPGVPIPEFISHLTNIHDKDVADAPTFHEISTQILDFIGDCPIVGHFISFDIDFLKAKDLNIKNPLYDTAELARIFIPGLPSYSLEILSSVLSITHTEKHRALDDSIAAQELFMKILEEAKKLPHELLEEIKELSGRSSWEFAKVLAEVKAAGSAGLLPSKPNNAPESAPTTLSHSEEQTISLIIEEKKSSLIETPIISAQFVEELSRKTSKMKGTVILCSQNTFQEITLPKISAIDQYISPARLEIFKRREKFNTPQITALIKTLIWLEKTDTGLLSDEIQFSQDERQILGHITIDTEEKEPFAEHVQKIKTANPIIANFKYVPEEEIKHLIITDVNKFIQDFYYANSQILLLKKCLEPIQSLKDMCENETLIELTKKLELLFALLEKIGERNFEESAYLSQFELSPLETSDRDFVHAREVVQALISTSHDLKEINNTTTLPYLKAWKNILKDLEKTISNVDLTKNLIVFQKNQSNDLIVRNIPISIVEQFKNLSRKTKCLTLLGKSLDALDDCRLIKKLLGLEADTKFHQISADQKTLKETRIFVVNDIRGSQNDIIKSSIEFGKNFLNKEKGRTAFIFNSMAKLEQFHVILAPKLKKEGLFLFAQKGSGGLGKILEMYKGDPTVSTLLLTPNHWERFNPQDLSPENDFENLIIQQIPFDPPSDPFLMAQGKNFQDGWNEFQIPRAMLSLKSMINKFLVRGGKRVIILDNRLVEKSYTKPFIDMLKSFSRPEEIASKTLT